MILVLTQTFPPDTGGIESTMGHLARAFARTGEATLVLADRVRRGGDPAAPPGDGYALRRFGGPKPLRRRLKALVARRLVARGGVTAIVADSWKSLEFLPRPPPSRPGAPALVLAHGNEFPADAPPARAARIRRALAGAAAISPNSAYTAGLVRGILGAGGPPLTVVHPAVERLPDPTPEARAEVAALLGGRSPVLLTLARLEPRKGVDRVIAALPALAARHPGLIYLVAGSGDDVPRLRALAAATGVADRVRFLGRVPDSLKPALLAAADVFAMPARREGASVEGFGVSYLEAALFAVPSLAGREGGAADAVRDEETGLLCDGADPAAVEAALARLLDSPGLRARLGTAAREAVRGSDWNAVAAHLLRLVRPG